MSLVQYSDSDSDDGEEKSKAHSALPPLPPSFHDLYAASTRVSVQDDPALHGGRKRVIPHVEGNWPTHLYLEYELPLLADLIDSHHSLLHSDLGAQLPLHISLSRPVVLRTEQRASFTERLERVIKTAHIPPFTIQPAHLDWVSNHEHTRWFLVFRVQKPARNNLNRLLRLANDALAHFHQPPLYERDTRASRASAGQKSGLADSDIDYSDCFHISLAWSLGEPDPTERERVRKVDLKALQGLRVGFDSVKAKIGNHVEDLQTFHSKHFPHQPPATLPEYTNEQNADDDPDLGFYPDGVQRTLTDEQIRIFRHSEIHALLRERQLREDDEEYEVRRGKSLTGDDDENQDVDAGDEEPTQSSRQEAVDGDTQLKSVHEEKKSKKTKKKSTTKNRGETVPVSEPLDYSEDNLGHDTPQTERPVSNVPYSGRRIVSYDD
ncbi:hypothetical protein N7474_003780 [Penicillium riverlandense]|uniref:uncharacterized protein n=1 Tax=Penicillium riverlandense TaxID=1903569 RepID=UPI0025498545|nr:uncharacterized protein N7474_003780 [Penicillium riverlandense]KAJ5818189.1 hypothetical protein N7474_003780 [Penicillium riverlandense]